MTEHVSITKQFLINGNFVPVEAGIGSKSPKRDPKTIDPAVARQTLENWGGGDTNYGIHLFGQLVDVDVDAKESRQYLIPALDHFLPHCSHVWGRASKPRSHRLYMISDAKQFDPKLFPVIAKFDAIPECKVELRGGAQQSSTYSLLPGSMHPSGEEYQWASTQSAQSSLSVTEAQALVRAVRKAGAIAVLGPIVAGLDGSRQEFLSALAGALQRFKSMAEDFNGQAKEGDESFYMDRVEAEDFFDLLVDLADPTSADKSQRKGAFNLSWNKGEAGEATTGLKRMVEIFDPSGKETGRDSLHWKIFSLLSDNENAEKLQEFQDRFVINNWDGSVTDLHQVEGGSDKFFMSRVQYQNAYSFHKITLGGGKPLRLTELFWDSQNTKHVDDVCFMPGSPLLTERTDAKQRVTKLVNLAPEFGTIPYASEVSDDEVKPFIDYLHDVICDKNAEAYKWVAAWLSDIFQRPCDKPGTALVLLGSQGTGKSFLGENILDKILGQGLVASVSNVNQLTKNFNVMYTRRLLLRCEEALHSSQKQLASSLKDLVTNRYTTLEPKGLNAVKVENHARLIFTSNERRDALTIDADDRRYTVLETADTYAATKRGNQEYWTALAEWLDHPETLPKIYRWFLQHKYDPQSIRKPVMTEAKKVVQSASWDTLDKWILHVISQENWVDLQDMEAPESAFRGDRPRSASHGEWPDYVNAVCMFNGYKRFSRLAGDRIPQYTNPQRLITALKDRGVWSQRAVRQIRNVEVLNPADKNNPMMKTKYRVFPTVGIEDLDFYLSSKYNQSTFLETDAEAEIEHIIDEVRNQQSTGTHNDGLDF